MRTWNWMILLIMLLGAWPARSRAWTTNQPADVVIGQPNMTSNSSNQGGGPGANTICYPVGVQVCGQNLYLAEQVNSRVLKFNRIPTTNNASADIVMGQAYMTSNAINQGSSPQANTIYYPNDVYAQDSRLFVTDTYNNRILIYNPIPAANNASANVVIGQANMTSNASNQGNSVQAYTLFYPRSAHSDGQRLFVADDENNRILIYNSIPSGNNAAADLVVGQANMTSKAVNQGGSPAANSLKNPGYVYAMGGRLLISDSDNNRVLIYNHLPASNNASADIVIGQANMTSNSVNQGGSPGANTLRYPKNVIFDGYRLLVSDSSNNRVLIYNDIPTANNTSADVVIGQANMTSAAIDQGGSVGTSTLHGPHFAYSDALHLYIADHWNHRVLIYYNKPAINLISQDHALSGQALNLRLIGNDLDAADNISIFNQNLTLTGNNLQIVDAHTLSVNINFQTLPGVFDIKVENSVSSMVLKRAITILGQTNKPAQWQIQDIGQADQPPVAAPEFSVAIGDANRDGAQEVYVSNMDLKVMMLKKTDVWNPVPFSEEADNFKNLVMADGNRDGDWELYAASNSPNIYQYFYLGGQWNQVTFTANQTGPLTAGDGDNDGNLELYHGNGNDLLEFNYQGSWTSRAVGSGAGTMACLAIGDGNHDQSREVYAANTDQRIYQFKYSGGNWAKTTVAVVNNGPFLGLAMGDPDKNGMAGIYGAHSDGRVYQFLWNGTGWDQQTLYDVGNNAASLTGLAISDADNDGTDEIYVSCLNGHVYQIRSGAGTWQAQDLGAVGVALRALAVGDGDNDYGFEIYAMGANSHIYQFKAETGNPSTPTPTPSLTAPDHQIKAYPSRFNPATGGYASIRWYQSESEPATIKIYNLRGELVKIMADHANYTKGVEHEIIWRGINNSGSTVASGIYVVHIQAGNYQDKIKICVIK